MKSIFFSVILSFCIISCSKKEEIIEPNIKNPNKATIITRAAGDGKNDLLGYGYNFLYALGDNYKGATNPVIDIHKFITGEAADPNTGKTVSIPKGKVEIALAHGDLSEYQEYGTSLYDFYQRINGKISFNNVGSSEKKIIPKWGIVELSYEFDKDITNKEQNSFYKLDLCLNTNRVYFSSINVKRLRYFLSDDFIYAIHNYTAKEIVDDYGTHVLTDIYTGGKLSVLASALEKNTTQNDLQTLTKNIMGFVTGNISKNIKITENLSNLTLSILQSGGSNPISTRMITSNNGYIETNFIDWNQWKSGVDTQHSTLIHTNLEKIIPIWDFIDDPKLKEDVIDEIIKRSLQQKVDFKVTSVPEFTLTRTTATVSGWWDTRSYIANNNILSFDKDDFWTIIPKKRLDCPYIINHSNKFNHDSYRGLFFGFSETKADTLRIKGRSIYFELPDDYTVTSFEYNKKYYNKVYYVSGSNEYFKDTFEDVLEIKDSQGNSKEVSIKFNFNRR